MTEETPTTESQTAMVCPKDGTAMAPLGRRGRGGAYRCPTCKSVFLDVEAMRHGRSRQQMTWAPLVMSVAMSLVMTALVRRLRHRSAPAAAAPTAA
ncbi:MAG TPA: zf-TFIIB domain-containing protein [Candidatus Baltobacteraceae bacterium]|nr:zf-TFIIB domain-containing protein [Candidatus Baltobacteraceae bacterium]